MQHTLRGTSSHLVAGAHGNSIGSKFLQVRQCTVDGSCARLLSTLVRIRHGTYPVSHVYAPPKQVNGLAAARLAHPLGPCRANTECRVNVSELGQTQNTKMSQAELGALGESQKRCAQRQTFDMVLPENDSPQSATEHKLILSALRVAWLLSSPRWCSDQGEDIIE